MNEGGINGRNGANGTDGDGWKVVIFMGEAPPGGRVRRGFDGGMLWSADFAVFEDDGEGLGVDGAGGVGGEGFEEDEEFGNHVGGKVLGHCVFDPGEAEGACAGDDVGDEVGCALFVDVVDDGAVGDFVALAHCALDFAGDYLASEDVDLAVFAAEVGVVAVG